MKMTAGDDVNCDRRTRLVFDVVASPKFSRWKMIGEGRKFGFVRRCECLSEPRPTKMESAWIQLNFPESCWKGVSSDVGALK